MKKPKNNITITVSGLTGSGKSTLIHCIANHLSQAEGLVDIVEGYTCQDEQRIRGLSQKQLHDIVRNINIVLVEKNVKDREYSQNSEGTILKNIIKVDKKTLKNRNDKV
jgi:ABC-type phosphate/phosphonate transport system ATPase subunit